MALLQASQTKVLKIVVDKCVHLPTPVRRVKSAELNINVEQLFKSEHGDIGSTKFSVSMNNSYISGEDE